jgi:hypothetical protein
MMMKMMQLLQLMTKKTNSGIAIRLAITALSLTLLAGVVSMGPGVLATRAQGAAARRTVEGKVHDKSEAPVAGAVVYLKDSRTLAVKSFISDEQGVFHFGQLSQNTDYEVYAEFKGKRSKSRKISSFDTKNSFNFTLTIDEK